MTIKPSKQFCFTFTSSHQRIQYTINLLRFQIEFEKKSNSGMLFGNVLTEI